MRQSPASIHSFSGSQKSTQWVGTIRKRIDVADRIQTAIAGVSIDHPTVSVNFSHLWESIISALEEFAKQNPGALIQLLEAGAQEDFKDGVTFARSNKKLFSDTFKLAARTKYSNFVPRVHAEREVKMVSNMLTLCLGSDWRAVASSPRSTIDELATRQTQLYTRFMGMPDVPSKLSGLPEIFFKHYIQVAWNMERLKRMGSSDIQNVA